MSVRPETSQPVSSAKTGIHYNLFYGDGCPHCAKVEAFIRQNGLTNKLSLESKEIYYNSDNAPLLGDAAKFCGLPSGSIDVPFLYDGSKCIAGDADKIAFLKQRLGIR